MSPLKKAKIKLSRQRGATRRMIGGLLHRPTSPLSHAPLIRLVREGPNWAGLAGRWLTTPSHPLAWRLNARRATLFLSSLL
jgi:hypothetical protein